MSINKTLFGKLDMNDEGQFILECENETVNITEILDNIFDSSLKPQVYIKILKNGRLLYDEDGLITICEDKQKVESHYVCFNNLDKLLFYETGEMLEIEIIERSRGRSMKNDKIK